ncbi:LLM class flavin-dependent oxidoreductase [Mycolicibacterium sp. P9-22]|uniref:LLM class flavin-dependent oxidoreductase n=1 Tax=Mycolicibacterium sp. P9-22 TaxID=2024613 RepID=UPI0011EFD296|nr:LLM class flavin-dependent oxidoreductase [Mycolicibacterium sp. P9-22]KAA0115957.1 LLM class flavin-dependent oxidoreductase [Mycolicibacterium sp. P9-22]
MAVALSVGVEVVGDGVADRKVGAEAPARGIAGLARRLESAGVGYWVIGAERGESTHAGTVTLDPSLIATIAARHSTRLGLVVSAAGHRDHPYNLARRLISVDHAAQGRVGWLALDFDHSIALNAASDTWTGAHLDATHTDDAVAAVRTLWRTWPLGSVLGDTAAGVFADVTQIRRADVRAGYAITGPLNVPGSVQGDLPVWRQATRGSATAPSGADLVVVEDREPVPDGTPVVIRVRSLHSIAATLDRISGIPAAHGVLLRVDPQVFDHVLERVLPAARRRGVIGGPGEGTLRGRLRLPVPESPDLSGHAAVFDTVPNPGGRL